MKQTSIDEGEKMKWKELPHDYVTMWALWTRRKLLVWPRITRFVTTFLILSCLMNKKSQFAAIVSSEKLDAIDGQK